MQGHSRPIPDSIKQQVLTAVRMGAQPEDDLPAQMDRLKREVLQFVYNCYN